MTWPPIPYQVQSYQVQLQPQLLLPGPPLVSRSHYLQRIWTDLTPRVDGIHPLFPLNLQLLKQNQTYSFGLGLSPQPLFFAPNSRPELAQIRMKFISIENWCHMSWILRSLKALRDHRVHLVNAKSQGISKPLFKHVQGRELCSF